MPVVSLEVLVGKTNEDKETSLINDIKKVTFYSNSRWQKQ